jgi:2-methylcitrate dehydratase PrpD
MVSTGKTKAELLADFVYRTAFDDLSKEAITMARKMVLDQLGVELACSVLPWNKKVLQYVKSLSITSNQSTVVADGMKTSAEFAAFANAIFGHGFEIDDFAPAASAHPGCVAVPASLTVGEQEHLSGKDLLTGVALASEVTTRVGESGMKWMLARGFHETCILGVFGASAVAAKMLGMDAQHIALALSIAGSHASGTTEFAQSGGDVKRLHAGLGANGGIRSALLARNGLTGPLTILEGKRGVLESFAGQFVAESLTDGLGDRYAFLINGFKPYCCAIDMHSPIDALTKVLVAQSLAPEDIAEIVVPLPHVLMLHSGAIGPEPHDIVGAQLSMHYSLALTVCKRSNDFDTYLDAWKSGFKDPAVLAVARKVSVVQISEPENSEGAKMSAFDSAVAPDAQGKSPVLTVKTKGGKTYVQDLLPSKGSPKNPMTYEELEHKFTRLATRVMPKEQASEIASLVRDLENVKDLHTLTELLVCPPDLSLSEPRT